MFNPRPWRRRPRRKRRPSLPSSRKFFLFFDFAFNNARGLVKAKTAALHFLDTEIRPDDEVGVLSYSMLKGVSIYEYLTRDHTKVREVLDTIGAKGIAGRASEMEALYWQLVQEPAAQGSDRGCAFFRRRR